jgi:hypothetical protein
MLFEQVMRYNVVWGSLCLINREAVPNQVIIDNLIFTTKFKESSILIKK